ncbi:sugar ABC transporter ATP-binding protein [Nesterenkonia sp. YGD6]|uniref:ATP-binding cassette domain-containing protein n=1 Tax=Nesterenkonia sp. YGD6 TaxID=2901231 RepID=UPI001F4CB0B5|nr:sugar ABC transporter ATP-binding protein [Nesterenkonia sp. YGD6]MCH8562890.1 sugar ABC transporter ATP-binding protein [Nesterenkonia sp. YGD6]
MTTNAPGPSLFAEARTPETTVPAAGLITCKSITKRYGRTVAVDGVDLTVRKGEILGLVGHNGAGKSTLTRILAGREQPDQGSVDFAETDRSRWNAATAEAAGVRMVYQELALCADLTVAENAYLSDRRPSKTSTWPRTAERRILETLDDVFPGHGIAVIKRAGDLPMAKRQMVEIARALCTDNLRLLILDEPTESLGGEAAGQMYRYLHALVDKGVTALLISHRMKEVITHSDRIVVMKDGRVAAIADAESSSENDLLSAMGGDVHVDTETMERIVPQGEELEPIADEVVASIAYKEGLKFEARTGEIIGLAGLDGQGQEAVLKLLWAPGILPRGVSVPKERAYVPGDRQVSGIFPLWTVADNLTIAARRAISTFGFVNLGRKRDLARYWVDTLRVRGGALAPINSLSGGNQQKVLVARAFAADASLVLLDDPFRGVDVTTKNELYALMKAEASQGRAIVWYSTDNKEMSHCDRVYVFRAGRIVSMLHSEEITDERLIADSFADATGSNS